MFDFFGFVKFVVVSTLARWLMECVRFSWMNDWNDFVDFLVYDDFMIAVALNIMNQVPGISQNFNFFKFHAYLSACRSSENKFHANR